MTARVGVSFVQWCCRKACLGWPNLMPIIIIEFEGYNFGQHDSCSLIRPLYYLGWQARMAQLDALPRHGEAVCFRCFSKKESSSHVAANGPLISNKLQYLSNFSVESWGARRLISEIVAAAFLSQHWKLEQFLLCNNGIGLPSCLWKTFFPLACYGYDCSSIFGLHFASFAHCGTMTNLGGRMNH